MNEEQKKLYAQWILDECNNPIEEIQWLVDCILNNKGKKVFIQNIQWVLDQIKEREYKNEEV